MRPDLVLQTRSSRIHLISVVPLRTDIVQIGRVRSLPSHPHAADHPDHASFLQSNYRTSAFPASMEADVRGTRFTSLKLFPQLAPTMLILPLLIWWARSSFAISRDVIQAGISVLTITVMAMSGGTGCTLCCAADGYHRSMGFSAVAQMNSVERNAGGDESGFSHQREGTLLPPTVGRIVMLGRRWAFVPTIESTERQGDDFVGSQPTFKYSSVRNGQGAHESHNEKPRPSRLGGATPNRQWSVQMTSTAVGDGQAESTVEAKRVPHVIIVENLMLQRIVEAVRADASDDHWMVSGEVTEYFKENRLIIRTAQRANSR